MLSIYICEDNPIQLNHYRTIVENIILMEELDMKIQAAVTNPDELLTIAKQTQQNQENGGAFYLLDIDLNANKDGFDVAQAIREFDSRGFIAFITTHSEMAMLTFKYQVEAMDFILKDDIWSIGTHIRSCLEVAKKRYITYSQVPMLAFKTGDQTIYIEQDRIQYIATSSTPHKVTVVTENSITEFYGSLKKCSEVLPQNFIRCHKAYIVNVNHITSVDRKTFAITFANNHTCFASTRGITRVLRAIKMMN
ncbi:MAG: response regulator transcription factor [Lachnospiraceae bacterium]|nr:response regulator transcription factor [Lachnospiraceae bacterium]